MNTTKITYLKPHISLNVKSVSKSVDFYSKLFGTEPIKFIPATDGRMGYAKFDISEPPINFVLNEAVVAEGGSLSHLGLQVASTDDVLKIRERWTVAGLMTVDEMRVDCCYALQDKTWARDPDGNEWEAFVVLENTEPVAEACDCGSKVSHPELADDATSQEAASPCCTPGQKASTIAATNSPCC